MKNRLPKILSIILAFILTLGNMLPAFAADEIPEGYTPIYTAEDLNNIRNNLSGNYILMNDIDLSAYENWEPIGTKETPFAGAFDGNGYLIKNMKIIEGYEEEENYLGFFGVTYNAYLTRIIVENGYIFIDGSKNENTLENDVSAGMIAGMLIGQERRQLRDAASTGQIDVVGFGVVSVGGLIGKHQGLYSIVDSSNYVDISICTADYKQEIFASGIVATKEPGLYEDFDLGRVANYGDIFIYNDKAPSDTKIYVSGISNYQLAKDTASNCYNEGNIVANNSNGKIFAAGIIGYMVGRIENCLNMGKLQIPCDEDNMIVGIGGLVGAQPRLDTSIPGFYEIENCYYSNEDLPPSYQDSNDDYNYLNNVIFINKNQAANQETFGTFDFNRNWTMHECGYPVLATLPQISVTQKVEIEIGDQTELPKFLKAESSNKEIADISESCKIIGISSGRANITVKIDENYYFEYTVTVTEPTSTPTPEPNCFLLRIFNFIKSICRYIIEITKSLVG